MKRKFWTTSTSIILISAILLLALSLLAISRIEKVYRTNTAESIEQLKRQFLYDSVQNQIKRIDTQRTITNQRYEAELGRQRIIGRARGEFVDPSDVLNYLDLDSLDPPDDRAIDLALTELAEKRPYLLTPKGRAALGGIDQGPQGGSSPQQGSPDDFLRGAIGSVRR